MISHLVNLAPLTSPIRDAIKRQRLSWFRQHFSLRWPDRRCVWIGVNGLSLLNGSVTNNALWRSLEFLLPSARDSCLWPNKRKRRAEKNQMFLPYCFYTLYSLSLTLKKKIKIWPWWHVWPCVRLETPEGWIWSGA